MIFFERSPSATAVVTSAMFRTWSVRLFASVFTFSVRPRHVPETPSTCAWPPRRPSVPTSRATRVTSAANAESWSTIVLIVSLSSRISPLTSTVIFFERSPFATAVVTSAMFRTWEVRLPASVFTLSVRSFQTPETPSTVAWPPSLPSVPTSRATRVTSAENARSWSTIVLTVSFSSSTSPRTSTVIFFERSPSATAVVTSAMFRTWSVRLSASVFTFSVRSLQTPETPSTCAWPPSLPSVPTSFATRVTSAENERSWSTIVLMVSFSSSTSPLTSTVIFFERSPFATAVVTAAMFRTWQVRLPASVFTFSVRSFHTPETPFTCAWPPSLPSVPTSRATRVTSSAKDESWSTIVLTVFFSSSTSPLTSTVTFFERSPFATAVVTSAMFRTCPVRFEAIWLTESVRSFQVPETPFTLAWPPSLPSVPTSRATRVTSAAKHESWSTIPFTVVPMRRNSPRTGWPSISSWIRCDRSPSATASITRATSIVGRARLSISSLTAPIFSAHEPGAPAASARSLMRPSRPTTLLIRVNSFVTCWLRSTSALKAAATSASGPSARRRTREVAVARGLRARRRAGRAGRSSAETIRSRHARAPRSSGLGFARSAAVGTGGTGSSFVFSGGRRGAPLAPRRVLCPFAGDV